MKEKENKSLGCCVKMEAHSAWITTASGRSSQPKNLVVNFVNLVNLPRPYCICNVKNGQKYQENGVFNGNRENLHYIGGTPTLCSPSSPSSQVHKMVIFGRFSGFSMKKLGFGGVA